MESQFYLLFLIEVDNVVKCHLEANLELHDFSLTSLLEQKIFRLLHNVFLCKIAKAILQTHLDNILWLGNRKDMVLLTKKEYISD